MILSRGIFIVPIIGIPRESGDDPDPPGIRVVLAEYSPRERG